MELKIEKVIFFFYLIEFFGYIWHRNVHHMGLLGNVLRVTHWKHHCIDYPAGDMWTNKMKENTSKIVDREAFPFTFGAILFSYICYKNNIIDRSDLKLYSIMVISMGILNQYIHDSYHIKNHWLNKYKFYRKNKICHDIHHRLNCNYGILTYTFDRIFGTYSCQKLNKIQKITNLFPGMDEYTEVKGLPYHSKELKKKFRKYYDFKKKKK